MIAAVVGCGSWGARVARRLAEIDDVIVGAVFDIDRDRARHVAASLPTWPNGGATTEAQDLAQYLDVMTPDAVVVAVPPQHRVPIIDAVLGAKRKPRLRVEKPLAINETEATSLARRCVAAGVQLTVGFTLLHHPLYDAAFDYFEAIGEGVYRVTGIRVGRPPAHDADAMSDLGIHTASIAAHLGVGRRHTEIVSMYLDGAGARTTQLQGMRGSIVEVDELALEVRTPHGSIHVSDGHDALGRDLEAWVHGTHRGSVEVGLAAQQIIAPGIEAVAA
jgi:predicted dehydrogenase